MTIACEMRCPWYHYGRVRQPQLYPQLGKTLENAFERIAHLLKSAFVNASDCARSASVHSPCATRVLLSSMAFGTKQHPGGTRYSLVGAGTEIRVARKTRCMLYFALSPLAGSLQVLRLRRLHEDRSAQVHQRVEALFGHRRGNAHPDGLRGRARHVRECVSGLFSTSRSAFRSWRRPRRGADLHRAASSTSSTASARTRPRSLGPRWRGRTTVARSASTVCRPRSSPTSSCSRCGRPTACPHATRAPRRASYRLPA